jgi:Zn-dependent protease
MDLSDPGLLSDIAMMAPPMLLALTVHEYAHARTALAFGDPTALRLGRVSLNPLRHLDLVGTLVFVFTRAVGWGKPVPVNPFNLHPRRLGDAMVSAAGPVSNLVLALISAGLFRLLLAAKDGGIPQPFVFAAGNMLWYSVILNLGLCVFNLTPLFPLDGHHIVREMLPPSLQEGYMRWQLRYGMILFLVFCAGPGLLRRFLGIDMYDPIGSFHSFLIDRVGGLLVR